MEKLHDTAVSYGVSLAIWDDTELPATRHKWTHPDFTPARQAGTPFTEPFKDGGLSKPKPRVQRATGPRLLRDSPRPATPEPTT